jgi:hypothetical protein
MFVYIGQSKCWFFDYLGRNNKRPQKKTNYLPQRRFYLPQVSINYLIFKCDTIFPPSGPFGHFIHGVHEENYIAYVMAYSACIGPYANNCHSLETGRTPKSWEKNNLENKTKKCSFVIQSHTVKISNKILIQCIRLLLWRCE